MDIDDASPYEIFSATIDNEYSAGQIEDAAITLKIAPENVLSKKSQYAIVEYLDRQQFY